MVVNLSITIMCCQTYRVLNDRESCFQSEFFFLLSSNIESPCIGMRFNGIDFLDCHECYSSSPLAHKPTDFQRWYQTSEPYSIHEYQVGDVTLTRINGAFVTHDT